MSTLRRLAVATVTAVAVASPLPASAAAKTVVHGKLTKFRFPTGTYSSSHGRFAATFVALHRYRLNGRIDGKKLTGSFRTRQVSGGGSFVAKGSGTLGGRAVRISGRGPTNLSRATLVLR